MPTPRAGFLTVPQPDTPVRKVNPQLTPCAVAQRAARPVGRTDCPFNRAFKTDTGMTPTDYRRSALAQARAMSLNPQADLEIGKAV
jgi:methylphosphotriester-DNA--protein-cysteine methyltransferase